MHGSRGNGSLSVVEVGGSVGIRQQQVMAVDGSAASETGGAQVRGGSHGETTRYRYAGSETVDAQVGG